MNRTLLIFALLISSATYADTFDVQIGAFRYPDITGITLPANVGELRSTSGPNGLTRFVVGPFDNRPDAKQALQKLKAAGFATAFIRTNRDGNGTAYASYSTPAAATQSSSQDVSQPSSSTERSQREFEKLMSYSEEERRDMVFLDGRLHRKVGDEFVPL